MRRDVVSVTGSSAFFYIRRILLQNIDNKHLKTIYRLLKRYKLARIEKFLREGRDGRLGRLWKSSDGASFPPTSAHTVCGEAANPDRQPRRRTRRTFDPVAHLPDDAGETTGSTLFLLSSGAPFVRGHCLVVDGGWRTW